MKKSVWGQVVAVGVLLVVGVMGASTVEAQDHDPCNFYEDSSFGGRSCAGNGNGCMECNFDFDGDWITIYVYSPTPSGPSRPPRLGVDLAAAVDLRESDGDWGVVSRESAQALRSCRGDGRIFDVLDQRRREGAVPFSTVRAWARRYSHQVVAR